VNSKTITETQLFEDQIRELNSSYYSCINRIKELIDENQQLKIQIEELKNNANV
jgi:regulator of replication initiation timing